MRIKFNWGGKRRLEVHSTSKERDEKIPRIQFTDYCSDYDAVVKRYVKFYLGGWLYSLPEVELEEGSVVQLSEIAEIHNPGYGCSGYLVIVLRVLKGHPTRKTLETALGYQIANPEWIHL